MSKEASFEQQPVDPTMGSEFAEIEKIFSGPADNPSPQTATPTPSSPAPAPDAKPAMTPAPTPSPAAATPGQVPVPTVGAAPGTVPGVTPQPIPGTPQVPGQAPDLASTLGELAGAVRDLRSQPTPAAQPQAPAPDPWTQVPSYQYDIPAEMSQMLLSEDPNQSIQGMKLLATGISRTVHSQVNAGIKQIIETRLLPYVGRMVANQMAQAELFRTFYGENKDLDNDMYRDGIVKIAQTLVPQMGGKWNPQVAAAVANAARRAFNLQVPGMVPQVQVPAPPAMVQQGSTPGATRPTPGAQNSVGDQVHELMSVW